MIPVQSDFITDLRDLVARSLATNGFAADASEDAYSLVVRHINVQHRRIQPRPRPTIRSNELNEHESTLSDAQRKAIRRIDDASRRGDDLTPYLSRKVVGEKKRGDFNDRLLCEWDVHHMHLGDGVDADGKVTGTKEILFVLARDEALYLIDVLDHQAFADQRLFDIIASNWPPLSARFEMGPAPRAGGIVSAQDRTLARASGVNAVTVGANGKSYLAIGGGISTDGSSASVGREADRLLNDITDLEASYRANGDEIASALGTMTGQAIHSVQLKLIATNGGVFRVVETQTGIELRPKT